VKERNHLEYLGLREIVLSKLILKKMDDSYGPDSSVSRQGQIVGHCE